MEYFELNNVNPGDENAAFMNQIQQHQLQAKPNEMHQQNYQNQSSSYFHHKDQLNTTARYPKTSRHRELPVDVPDSFVGVAKQSPRYPPPKPNRRMSPPHQHNIPISSNHSNNQSNMNGQYAQRVPSQAANHILTHNSSLRDSIKLKQLENPKGYSYNHTNGTMQAAVNKAFELDEDDLPNNILHQTVNHQEKRGSYSNARQHKQSVTDLNSLYLRLENNLGNEFSSISKDAKLTKLLSIYSKIIETHNEEFKIPELSSKHAHVPYKLVDLIQSLSSTLRNEEITQDCLELLSILSKHEIFEVATTFDSITQKFQFAKYPVAQTSVPIIPDGRTSDMNRVAYNNQLGYEQVNLGMDDNLMYPMMQHTDLDDTMSIKTVRIEKSNRQHLGATIRRDDTTGQITIARLLCGGAAIQSGLLHEGDEILQVNGIEMTNRSTDEVVNLLSDMEGTLDFTIRGIASYTDHELPTRMMQHKIFVKAFFDYQGANDNFNPCKELRLNFERGDILCIVDQSDPNWWQATKENMDDSLAYLIPSENFLKQRERILNDSTNETAMNGYMKHEKSSPVSLLFNCGKNSTLKRRKKSMQMSLLPDDVPYYEELILYYPTEYFRRPIILVGPNSIGRREILRKLLQDSERFASAISHTSKPIREPQVNGVDFHVVSRAQFEADIKAGKFVEFGEFEKHYYGTSIDAIKKVVNSKKTCVHLVNGPSILNFRQGRAGSELKPFFIFVRPHHQIEKLQSMMPSADQNSHANLQRIIDEAQAIEDNYLPYFDKVLTVTDIEQAYQELVREINRIEREPQWIPLFWGDSRGQN